MTTNFDFHEKQVYKTQVQVQNSSGTAYVQDQFVLEQGFFGNVVNPEGIADGEWGTIDIDSDRALETSQINTGDTFAESTTEEAAPVYFDRTNAVLRDNIADGLPKVGELVRGGTKDASDIIRFKPVDQLGSSEEAEAVKTLTNSEIKNLLATPIEIVPAPGTGKVLQLISVMLKLNAGTEVLTETADNLAVEYDNGSAVACSEAIEATGFIDQLADTITNGIPVKDVIDAYADIANKNLAIANIGDSEYAGNATADATLTISVRYRIVNI
jgi:hypothetical protein